MMEIDNTKYTVFDVNGARWAYRTRMPRGHGLSEPLLFVVEDVTDRFNIHDVQHMRRSSSSTDSTIVIFLSYYDMIHAAHHGLVLEAFLGGVYNVSTRCWMRLVVITNGDACGHTNGRIIDIA